VKVVVNRSSGFFILAALCIAIQFGPAALAQDTGTAPPAEPVEVGPEPIPATRIPVEAEEDLVYLRGQQARIAALPPVKKVTENLPRLQRRIETLSAVPHSTEPESMSWRRRQNFRQQWQLVRADLLQWKDTIETRTTSLQKDRDRLSKLEEEWTLTLASGKEQKLAELLEQRVQTVLEETAKTEQAIADSLDSMTDAYLQVTKRLAEIDVILSRYDTAASRTDGRILFPDSQPIWRIVGNLSETGMQLSLTWQAHAGILQSTWERFRKPLNFMLVAFVLVALLLLRLDKRKDDWAAEPGIAAATGFLARPFAASLLISLTATGWLLPTSNLLDDLLLLLILLPMIRLAPVMIPEHLRGLFYFLTTLVLVQQTYNIVVDQGALQRLLLLALSLGGFVYLARALRHDRREWRGRITSSNLVVRIVWLATAAFLVAIGANVFGYVRLAEMLTEGTIRSAYLGIVLVVVAILLASVVGLALRGPVAQRSRAIRHHRVAIRDRIVKIVRWLVGIAWVLYVLGQFGLRDRILTALADFFKQPLQLGAIDTTPKSILIFVLAIWIAVKISQLLRFILENEVYPRSSLPRGAAPTISMLVNYAIVTLGFFFAVSAAGVELSQFAIVVGALGVGIGFGLQNVVNNFVSGLILIFERPVKVGDTVEVGALMGVVRRIGIRASIVRTYDGAEVIVPNGDLISTQVINWTLSDRLRRVKVPIGVAYGSDPERVREVLLEVGRAHKDTLDKPEPMALFMNFGNSSLNFELRVWTPEFDSSVRIQSELSSSVYHALADADIEIPFPQQDIHLRSVSDEAGRGLSRPPPSRSDSPDHGSGRDIGDSSVDTGGGEGER
jgi:small-conductance mechanosensitive channel